MAAIVLDGSKIRDQIKAELAEQIRDLKSAASRQDWQRSLWVKIPPRRATFAAR